MPRRRLLVIANCQGPILVSRFLPQAVPDLDEFFEVLPPVRVHLLSAADKKSVRELIAAADVVVAQPINRSILAEVTRERLVAATAGKELLFFPSLHWDAIFASSAKTVWKANEGYPFGQTEDAQLAAAFVAGFDPGAALEFWHEEPVVSPSGLRKRINAGIEAFRKREDAANVAVRMSDFYSEMWRNDPLHHIKSHPRALVYEELCRRLVVPLGLPAPDFTKVQDRRGNDQFELPTKRWVHDALKLDFSADHDHGRVQGERKPLREIIELFWSFYSLHGPAEVSRRLQENMDFRESLAAAQRVAVGLR